MPQNLNDRSYPRTDLRTNEAFLETKYSDAKSFSQRKIEAPSKRHVAFQASSRMDATASNGLPKAPVSKFNEVTALDHHIGHHDGTTSTLECLPHRLRVRSKNPKSLEARNEELTIENGYLQEELAYYKDTREVLMRFFESINEAHQVMKTALHQTSNGVAISEQRLLNYWGIHHDDGSFIDEVYFRSHQKSQYLLLRLLVTSMWILLVDV